MVKAWSVSWFILAVFLSAATLDGGIGMLLPMQEKTYRRLLMLQNALNTMLPHHAGLNPKVFRFVPRNASFYGPCMKIKTSRKVYRKADHWKNSLI